MMEKSICQRGQSNLQVKIYWKIFSLCNELPDKWVTHVIRLNKKAYSMI